MLDKGWLVVNEWLVNVNNGLVIVNTGCWWFIANDGWGCHRSIPRRVNVGTLVVPPGARRHGGLIGVLRRFLCREFCWTRLGSLRIIHCPLDEVNYVVCNSLNGCWVYPSASSALKNVVVRLLKRLDFTHLGRLTGPLGLAPTSYASYAGLCQF